MLNATEKKLLDKVLEVTGDREEAIRDGIVKALRGENDKARRGYLWRILSRAAKHRIRAARQKYQV